MAARVAGSLPVRQAVRQHLMAGRVGEAEALLARHAPALVGPAGDNCVFFYLACLKFIELVRCAAPNARDLNLCPEPGLVARQGRHASGGDTCVFFYLACLKLIELVRCAAQCAEPGWNTSALPCKACLLCSPGRGPGSGATS